MRNSRFLVALSALTLSVFAQASTPPWPEPTRDAKPWTRWWWPASAVDPASLTRQLEQLAAAGIGGVEITPIYGAKGYEDRYIDFLSPKWLAMLEHTGREAQRLGLGVDMATGTGWPFGGPWIDEAHGIHRAVLRDGKIIGEPNKMMVKRAAPGDEGLVVDPYSPDALRRYLAPFDQAFAKFPRGLVRGQFHDSFEYFNASWTERLPEVFREMHGYDIQQFAAALTARNSADVKDVDRDTLARVKADYRDTLAQLHLDYLRTWVDWSHQHGFLVRNQSHGAPANIFDLYATVDVAETEIFGSTPFPIPGLRRNADEIRSGNDQDLPESLVVRMASSAAHVVGHNLASSESLTWLREHWKESPSYMKPELDRILVAGINHIFYHGTVFSPQDAPWPGWLFYASTQMNPNNPLWDDLTALHRYVARVQAVLQRGQPDNDILLYWPIADIWDDADGLMKMLAVHNVKWLTGQPVGKLADALVQRGYSFDYISDAQLRQTRAEQGELVTRGGRYKVLVVPAARRMPIATLQHIAKLAQGGARVIFERRPEDVPGYGRLEPRRQQFKQALTQLDQATTTADVITAVSAHARREPIADAKISFIRRKSGPNEAPAHYYFLANLSAQTLNDSVELGVPAGRVAISDPLTGRAGDSTFSTTRDQPRRVRLRLAPGESLLLAAYAPGVGADAPAWSDYEPAGAPVPLEGKWSITFTKGGPDLPPALETTQLKSWTDLGGDEAKRFAGTARYRLEFDAPTAKPADWLLDLGDVRETARVRLNGREVGTAWSIPFKLHVGQFLQPGRNVLELDVTNLAANRIRDLDQRKVNWKIMREINFVNINYRPFDASSWSLMPSGLLGPVTLIPLRATKE